MNTVPNDWENPDFKNKNKVHEWKNYVPLGISMMWQSFTIEQKKALFSMFNDIASNEEWD